MAETKSLNIDVNLDPASQAVARFRAEAVKMQADVAKATAEAAQAGEYQLRVVRLLEKEQKAGLTTAQRTAYRLEELRALHVEGAAAAELQARAVEKLTGKLQDQTRREVANAGRSLSMLFDEQNKLLALLPGRFGEVAQGLASIKAGAGDAASALSNLTRNAEGGFAAVGAVVGVAGTLAVSAIAAAGALAGMGISTAETVDQLDDLSQSLGVSVEELSQFQVAAGKVDGGLATIGKAQAKLLKLQGEARDGNEAAIKTLERLGIAADATATDALKGLAEAMALAPTAADRTALAVRALGDELALKLGPALADGAAGVQNLIDRNAALGLQVSTETLEATRRYKDAVEDLSAVWTGLTQTLGTKALPTLTTLALYLQKTLEGVNIFTRNVVAEAKAEEYLDKRAKERIESFKGLFDAYRTAAPIQEDATAKTIDAAAATNRAATAVKRQTEVVLAALPALDALALGLDRLPLPRVETQIVDVGIAVKDVSAAADLLAADMAAAMETAEASSARAAERVTGSLSAVGQVAQATGAGIASALAQGIAAIVAADSAAATLGSTLSLVLGVARAVGARFDELSQRATGMGFREASQTEQGAAELTAALEDIRWDDVAQKALEAFGRGFRVILVSLPSIVSELLVGASRAILGNLPSIVLELLAGATQALAGAQGQGLIGQIAVDLIVALAKGLPPLMVQIARSFWVGIFKAAREFYGALGDLIREALSRALEALGLDRAAERVEGGGRRQRVGDITLPPGPSRVLETSPGDAVHIAQAGGPGDTARLMRQQNGLLETLIGLQRQQLTEAAELRRALARTGRPMGMTPTLA